MRKSFNGLMAIIRDTYQMDPYANALYPFCGHDSRKLKALHFDREICPFAKKIGWKRSFPVTMECF